MKKRTQFVMVFIFIASAVFASGNGITTENLKDGKLVPNSGSPDGKFIMLEVHQGDTTATCVVVAPADRSKFFCSVPIFTVYMTDEPYESRVSISWNRSSRIVAVHDSLNRNSKLSLIRFSRSGATAVEVPDLLSLIAQEQKIDPDSIHSSGQVPVRWIDDSTLEVSVRIQTKAGSKFMEELRLGVSDSGVVSVVEGGGKDGGAG